MNDTLIKCILLLTKDRIQLKVDKKYYGFGKNEKDM